MVNLLQIFFGIASVIAVAVLVLMLIPSKEERDLKRRERFYRRCSMHEGKRH